MLNSYYFFRGFFVAGKKVKGKVEQWGTCLTTARGMAAEYEVAECEAAECEVAQ
jgi:hypothetical protein